MKRGTIVRLKDEQTNWEKHYFHSVGFKNYPQHDELYTVREHEYSTEEFLSRHNRSRIRLVEIVNTPTIQNYYLRPFKEEEAFFPCKIFEIVWEPEEEEIYSQSIE